MTSAHVFVMVFIPIMMTLLRPSTAQNQFSGTNNVDAIMQALFGSNQPVLTLRTSSDPSSCITPSGAGQCVLLSQCPVLMPLIREVHDDAVANYLRSIICRLEVNNVRICCANNLQQILPGSSKTSPPRNSRPSQPGQISFGGSSGNRPQNLPIRPTQNRPVQNLPSQPSHQNRPIQTTTTTIPNFFTSTPDTFTQVTQNRNPPIQLPQGIPNQPPTSLPILPPQTLPPRNEPIPPTQIVRNQVPQVGVSFPPSALQPDRQNNEQVPTTSDTLQSLTNNIPAENECGKTTLLSTNSESSDWPWLAAVGFLRNGGRFDVMCGGALITRRHVITAAHCFNIQKFETPTHVRLGDYDLGRNNDVSGPQDFFIAGYETPGYDEKTFAKDLVLITLSPDVVFNDFIQPVCLPFRFRYDGFRYQSLRVIGWRRTITSISGDDLPQTPQVFLAEGIGLGECRRLYGKSSKSVIVDRRNMCAAGGSQGTCLRDIGAPALYLDEDTTQRYFLAGIASFGFGCDQPAEPYVYTRIGAFLDWLDQKLQ